MHNDQIGRLKKRISKIRLQRSTQKRPQLVVLLNMIRRKDLKNRRIEMYDWL